METAFKSSEYPVILSLENHCSPIQQEKMAETFIEVFGNHLLGSPLENNPVGYFLSFITLIYSFNTV
jgi:phosphatidylinositol phospholipase C beta